MFIVAHLYSHKYYHFTKRGGGLIKLAESRQFLFKCLIFDFGYDPTVWYFFDFHYIILCCFIYYFSQIVPKYIIFNIYKNTWYS